MKLIYWKSDGNLREINFKIRLKLKLYLCYEKVGRNIYSKKKK